MKTFFKLQGFRTRQKANMIRKYDMGFLYQQMSFLHESTGLVSKVYAGFLSKCFSLDEQLTLRAHVNELNENQPLLSE